eukprot:CAMPEP_0181103226 /NCGR_PEP_ID=MMETSP1071-20121207/14751_1 /TAXON_ID=35127 /ORGANISM="Thalassiosira sp., Strain NH16" /LENGTH=148 /DNA_ID=CAMNT_0023186283 /DNA_START=168 /DNA_END=614 /DNA_ORIENTATION=-
MPRKDIKPDPQKQLMIKVKACQRLVKEASYYEKEVEENEAKLQRMKDEDKDQYDIKKFVEVLGESQMMIPDSACRRDRALDDLRSFVGALRKDEAGNGNLMGCTWMDEASKMLGGDCGSDAENERLRGDSNDDVDVTAVGGLAEGEAF